MKIVPYEARLRARIVQLSLKSWTPVYAEVGPAVPHYVYQAYYPVGWAARQAVDVGHFLDEEGDCAWVAIDDDAVVGWVGIRLRPEDNLGKIHMIAIDPDRGREGIASALLDVAFGHMRAVGLAIAMVETGDDPGHATLRAAYERAGFERWPVARYYREL